MEPFLQPLLLVNLRVQDWKPDNGGNDTTSADGSLNLTYLILSGCSFRQNLQVVVPETPSAGGLNRKIYSFKKNKKIKIMSRFLNVLRSWLVMVSVIAMGNTVQSFRDHSFLSEKLYTGTPEFVNGLQARTFGIWTLLSSIIRCACAIDIHNRTLYHITLWTFVLALGHFLSEAFIYKTAPLTIGVMAPLIVASFSIMGMLIGFQCFPESEEEVGARQKKRN